MRSMLSQIDLVIECRDYRIPLTSCNPMFEDSLVGQERLIVYTKKDMGTQGKTEEQKVGNTDHTTSATLDQRLMVSRDTRSSAHTTALLLYCFRTTSRGRMSGKSSRISVSLAIVKVA